MKILLRKLTISNFLSHEDTTIDFKPNGKVLIDGDSGAGKSTVVDAIVWALYGVGRVDNRSLIRHGESKAEVRLRLQTNDEVCEISRAVTASGKHALAVKMGDEAVPLTGIREAQEYIDKLVGASYLLFVNSVAHIQDNPENFVKQTAAKRKELILEIVKAASFDDYADLAKKYLAKEEALRDSLIPVRDLHEKQMKEAEASVRKLATLRSEKNEVDAALFALNKRLEETAVAATTFSIASAELRYIERDLGRAKIEEKNAEAALTTSSAQAVKDAADRVAALESASSGLEEDRRALKLADEWLHGAALLKAAETRVANIRGRKEDLEKELEELQAVQYPVCAGRKTPCPVLTAERDGQIKRIEKEIDKTMDEHDAEMLRYLQEQKELGAPPLYTDDAGNDLLRARIAVKEKEAAKLPEARNALVKAEAAAADDTLRARIHADAVLEVERIKADYAKKEVEIDAVRPAAEENKKHQAAYIEADKKLSAIKTDIALAEKDERRYHENKSLFLAMSEDIKKHETRISGLAELKKALGPNGIKAMVVAYVIPRLEERVNAVLSTLSDFRVRLSTARESADGSKDVEGLFIDIINGEGVICDFDAYSGGEKMKITIALSEALADMMNVGFRLLDESVVGLDEESVEQFTNVLLTLEDRFPQLLVISHLKPVKSLFDSRVQVSKAGGISRVMEK